MNRFIILTFLFAVGGTVGWGIEVIYRRFVSQKHWVNPGFLTGPCLPLYGFSLCILYSMARMESYLSANEVWKQKLLLFILMAIAITALEYVVGRVMISVEHIRLWDYTKCWGNIQGIICPQYSFYWMILSALYYFLVHPHILDALEWLSQNLAFSFGIGFYYGILVLDLVNSAQMINRIRKFAADNQLTIRLEHLREEINYNLQQKKPRFLFSMRAEMPFTEALKKYGESIREKIHRE